jgi:hypothetical protein
MVSSQESIQPGSAEVDSDIDRDGYSDSEDSLFTSPAKALVCSTAEDNDTDTDMLSDSQDSL